MPLVTVVIPSWNGRALLQTCLEALRVQTEQDFAVVVVDNGSSDGTVEWLSTHHPQVYVVANKENRGFAAPVNQGIRYSASPYVAVLNNDTEPEPGWLAALLAAADSQPRVGMVASKMIFADRPGVINSTGVCVDLAGISWDRHGGELDVSEEPEVTEIFGACAGAALYRRKMLDDIGLFDEAFFAYLEDVDLAWRARARGWRCLYAPQARVLHSHSATGIEGSPFKRYQLGRNKVRLIAKNYPFRELWWAVPLVMMYDVFAVVYALVARQDTCALRGRIAGLVTLGGAIKQRQHLKNRPDIRFLSPIVPPWRVSARYGHLTARK